MSITAFALFACLAGNPTDCTQVMGPPQTSEECDAAKTKYETYLAERHLKDARQNPINLTVSCREAQFTEPPLASPKMTAAQVAPEQLPTIVPHVTKVVKSKSPFSSSFSEGPPLQTYCKAHPSVVLRVKDLKNTWLFDVLCPK